jgi:hypothetical protein
MSRRTSKPRVLSLFTGAGGLDVGLEAAGFDTRLCVEVDERARSTLQRNRPRWRLASPGDIHALHVDEILEQAGVKAGEVELLAGGPPCQPFSKSSYWLHGDSRRLEDPRAAALGAYLRVVEAALPHVVLLENVRGLTFDGKDEGGLFDMAGLLVFTASPDADGTLGGLVRQGEPGNIVRMTEKGLAAMTWCSSDPLCIEGVHTLTDPLSGAACHACLLAAETSCEEFNRLLDRALLVGTPKDPSLGFFRDLVGSAVEG